MKIAIHSRKSIKKLIRDGFPACVAVISFCDVLRDTDESFDAVDYNGVAEELYQVAIEDIDIEELEEYGYSYDSYLVNVSDLAEFIYRAYERNMDIICQCEYGQSRSAGCAAAILEHFEKNGISVFRDYRYYPNRLIFNKVYEALEEKRRKLYE